jgi:hypothetical protein
MKQAARKAGLLFNSDEGDMLLRNVGWLSMDYMARYIPEGTILHNHRCLPELQILQNKT